MHDPIKQPKYWRDRAEATRAKAMQSRYAAPREMLRMMRVADEYDKLADRWQGNSELDAANSVKSK